MPYHITHGTLPTFDLQEYADTGLVVSQVQFTPRQLLREKLGHNPLIPAVVSPAAPEVPAAYNVIKQVQVFRQALDIGYNAEIIPDTSGNRTGLANVASGDHVELANFADGAEVHGFTCDEDKLLMVREVNSTVANEAVPAIEIQASYYPHIDAPES